MRHSPKLRRLAGAALIAIMLGATGAAAATLHRGNGDEPTTLDPAHATLQAESNILKDVLEGLTAHDAAGRVVPAAAESWTVSDDGLTYAFTIRADANWSNGDPLTAEDFVAAFRRVIDPAENAAYPDVLYPIANAEAINTAPPDTPVDVDTLGVTARGPKTLEIVLARPTPFLPELLAHVAALPVHSRSLKERGPSAFEPAALVSNGAYMVSDVRAGDHITLARRGNYWDAANVALEEVMFYPTADQAGAVRRFEAGELDVNTAFPADEAEALAERLGEGVARLSPTLAVTSIVFDTRTPPFNDARVRRALSLALDREAVAGTGKVRTELPLTTIVPPGIAGYTPAATEGPASREERLDAARGLLTEAGYGSESPLTMSLRYNSGLDRDAAAGAVADAWRALGVTVTTAGADTPEHYAYLRSGEPFEAAVVSFTANIADPAAFLALFASDDATFNFGKWSDPAFDDLLARAATELDAAARSATLADAEAMLLREAPTVPLTTPAAAWLVSPKVKGWQDNAADDHLSRFLSKE